MSVFAGCNVLYVFLPVFVCLSSPLYSFFLCRKDYTFALDVATVWDTSCVGVNDISFRLRQEKFYESTE